jgi:hypothetical protein
MTPDYTKYYITTYTKWTHDHFITNFSAREDVEWRQVVLRNNEVYGQLLVRSSTRMYEEMKRGINSNNGLAYNIEYAPAT